MYKDVVLCKECIHHPFQSDDEIKKFHSDVYKVIINFPDEECPLHADDPWYNQWFGDDWFCCNGKRKEK